MIKRVKYIRFTCDCCEYLGNYETFSDARKEGWAISRSRRECYCPLCAPSFRYVGSAGRPDTVKGSIFQIKGY